MTTFITCPHCGKPVDLFKEADGHKTAEALSVPLLGTIPFYHGLVTACDQGKPIMSYRGTSLAHKAFDVIAHNILEQLKWF